QQPVAVEAPHKAKKAGSTSQWVKWNVVVVVMLGICSWFFFSQRSTEATTNNNDNNNNNKAAAITIPTTDDSSHTKATISSGEHAAVAGPVMVDIPDTLRLSATKSITYIQHYADSTGKKLFLLPKTKNSHATALEINKSAAKPGDTMVIKNMHLKGFETGIRVNIPVHIKLQNMIFENVKYPVSYQNKPDSNNTGRSVEM